MLSCSSQTRRMVMLWLISLSLGLLLLAPVTMVSARQEREQEEKPQAPQPPEKSKEEPAAPLSKEAGKVKEKVKAAEGQAKLSPVEVIVESCIYLYGGRANLKASRSSIIEQGTIKLATEQGDISGAYMLRRVAKDKSWEDLLRTDIDLDTPEDAQQQGAPAKVKYTLAFNGASVWAAQNNRYVTPLPESEAAFRSQLSHDYTTLLRYKEDGSKIELEKPETVVGVATNVVDLTLPTGEKTRFWISARTYHILHYAYDLTTGDASQPKRITVHLYPPFRLAQNTLLQTRRVMEEGGRLVQEVDLDSFQYSAKLDPEIFQHLQE
ncbi:MAG TPA: hypothetical protein VJX67_08570 [Blastocatellia bacterium]|nr:hypothetical protein [Blastocatellia bacterium]